MRLYSDGLLSKWGFGDGGVIRQQLLAPSGLWWIKEFEHHVLRELVRTRLLPVIEQKVEVCEITTSHNPIRAVTVDGATVDLYADDEDQPVLTPEFVDIPDEEVLQVAAELEKMWVR